MTCTPPPGTAEGTWHLLMRPDESVVRLWHNGMWKSSLADGGMCPDTAGGPGRWRYIDPVTLPKVPKKVPKRVPTATGWYWASPIEITSWRIVQVVMSPMGLRVLASGHSRDFDLTDFDWGDVERVERKA